MGAQHATFHVVFDVHVLKLNLSNVRIQRAKASQSHNGSIQNLFQDIVDTFHLHTLSTLKQNYADSDRKNYNNQLPVAIRCSLCPTDYKSDILVDYIVRRRKYVNATDN